MSQGTLINHRGAVEILRGQNSRWMWDVSRSNSTVLETVEGTLASSGFAVAKAQLSVSHEDRRFFGVLDIRSEIADGVSLSVGVRNSCDKSFPIGFCAGTRTFVCDNLAFSSEVVIAKRHTRSERTDSMRVSRTPWRPCISFVLWRLVASRRYSNEHCRMTKQTRSSFGRARRGSSDGDRFRK